MSDFDDMLRLARGGGLVPLAEGRAPLNERVSAGRILPTSDWGIMDLLGRSAGSLHRALRGLRAELDAVAFQEPDLEEISLKLRDGPLAALEDLVARVGHGLGCYGFDEESASDARERFVFRGPLGTQGIALAGEVARLQALVKECLPRFKKGSADGDLTQAVAAMEDFQAKAPAALERVRSGITGVATAFAKINT